MRDGSEGDGIQTIPICRSWAYRQGLNLFLKNLMGYRDAGVLYAEADGW